MLLRSVGIENFRAVQSARITFEPTTVLIGENDCGRTSVMEALALALGWSAREGEFGFQPYHLHRVAGGAEDAALSIRIRLEFSETEAGEWEGEGFEPLRAALPEALGRDRRFRLEVTHSCAGITGWAFLAGGKPPLANQREMLAWLRQRMPVFRMSEGILAGVPAGTSPGAAATGGNRLADQVRRHYKELMEGTAPDVTAAIEGGAAAARRLLLSEAKLLPRPVTSLGELLEEIEGKPKSRRSGNSAEPLASFGSAANKIGVLLLVGAMLSGGSGSRGAGDRSIDAARQS